MTPVLQTVRLTHRYSEGTPFERVALDSVDFSAQRGEFIAVIGHTGSGKSTFIQHLNGLLKPSSGSVLFDGKDVHSSKEFSRQVRFRVGLLFQYPEYQLFEETVYRDIAFGPRNMKLKDDEVDERVREAADFVGLEESLLEKSPFDLSGGQKRRVAIAGVIAMRPEVLILDEPTAGLDAAGRDGILQNILDYREAQKATVIMVSHAMEEVANLCQRLIVMRKAAIAMDGTPDQVFTRARELTEMGLSVPQVTEIFLELQRRGIPVPDSVYTLPQAISALQKLKGGKTPC